MGLIYKRYFSFFILSILIFAICKSQNIENKPDSTFFYLQKAKANRKDNINLTLDYLKKAENFQLNKDQDKEDQVWASINLYYAISHYIKGNYEKSLSYYLLAEDNFRSNDDHLKLSRTYNGIGLIQQAIGRHKQALEYFQKAIETAPKNAETLDAYHLNIGISYIELNKLNEAASFFEKADQLALKFNDENFRHQVANRNAQILFLKGDFIKAKYAYNNILKEVNDLNNWEKSFAYAGMAETQLELNELKEATEKGLKSLEYAQEVNSYWDIHRNASILENIYNLKGDQENEAFYGSLRKKYEDSLYNRAKLSEINLLQLEYKEKENTLLTEEKERSEQKLLIIIVLLVLVIIKTLVALIVLIRLRKSNKEKSLLNQNLQETNEQLLAIDHGKNRMFSILSHDLKSPIASMMQLVELLRDDAFTETEKRNVLDEMHKQLTSTSLMLNNLLKWASAQMKNNTFEPQELELTEITAEVLNIYSLVAKNKDIMFLHDKDEPVHIIADKDHVNLVLHNLVSNAIKYTPEKGTIKVSYEVNPQVKFKIFNPGEPISKAKVQQIEKEHRQISSEPGTKNEYGTGLGLLLVKQYLKPNKAVMNIHPIENEGTEFEIIFKKA